MESITVTGCSTMGCGGRNRGGKLAFTFSSFFSLDLRMPGNALAEYSVAFQGTVTGDMDYSITNG